jgi:L-glyceraldehyde 3-phosphate reductase
MHTPDPHRYDTEDFYRRCGRSGLKLPLVSLGLWHNFGREDSYENARAMVLGAFDSGVTHFDLGNNYGPPPGAAEETLGRILREDLGLWRDELVISTKAGWDMWPGPYGDLGSRKYLLASLDRSLERLGLDYVDIFYHHRPDPDTPLEESMGALAHAVRSGKALYAGVSSYGPERTAEAVRILREMGTPCLVHQVKYSMFERGPEAGLFEVLEEEGVGCVAFSPLARGLLTDRYFEGVPADSRAASDSPFLSPQQVTEDVLVKTRGLNEMARARGQSLAQMALAWALRQPAMTGVIIGASKPSQVEDCLGAVANLSFTSAELARIDDILEG